MPCCQLQGEVVLHKAGWRATVGGSTVCASTDDVVEGGKLAELIVVSAMDGQWLYP